MSRQRSLTTWTRQVQNKLKWVQFNINGKQYSQHQRNHQTKINNNVIYNLIPINLSFRTRIKGQKEGHIFFPSQQARFLATSNGN